MRPCSTRRRAHVLLSAHESTHYSTDNKILIRKNKKFKICLSKHSKNSDTINRHNKKVADILPDNFSTTRYPKIHSLRIGRLFYKDFLAKKIANHLFSRQLAISALPGKDSNPHRRNQNPKCYHYTTGQICFASAKLRIYFGTAIANLEFFIRFNLFLHIYPFNGNADSMTAYDFFMRSSISCPLFSWG